MNREALRKDFIEMIRPFVRNAECQEINDSTSLVDQLNVNSARLVDIMLETEDRFQILIGDDEAGALTTVGGAVDLIAKKKLVSV